MSTQPPAKGSHRIRPRGVKTALALANLVETGRQFCHAGARETATNGLVVTYTEKEHKKSLSPSARFATKPMTGQSLPQSTTMETALHQDHSGPPGSKAHRTKETQRLRARAPLAAQFEDCAQAVRQLHAALNANPSISEQAPLRILIERCFRRLIAWGNDTGASSRTLDHSLRRAAGPQSSTLTLLKELHELVVNGAPP